MPKSACVLSVAEPECLSICSVDANYGLKAVDVALIWL